MYIRKAEERDAPLLSRICLLTAEAGKSAADLHEFGELPGLVFAVPYVKVPHTWGFVLVDDTDSSAGDKVVGYILGAKDTRAYETYTKEHWWPPLAAKYPPSSMTKEADVKYAKFLENMFVASDACISFAPAHMHIDILEEYQRQGWGRKLIERGVEFLKSEGVNGVWLGMDPRNLDARKFYDKLGFNTVEGADENVVGLKWE
ncbi:acyl-CoA N-acyltransferase [Flagelloscypha sp. PMI_526]|nr:acyl-CoA N-acyltransferase [Flagelloscypha sp. PMI_526]